LRTIAIIQARMGSTRLPGKAMMDILGMPMLGRVISRLKLCSLIEDIVVATTERTEDDLIEQFCQNQNTLCFRGSEMDVLGRYYQAALRYKAQTVVRITSDCPLIDPQVVDKVIAAYQKNVSHASGASNVIERSYPRGLDTEVISMDALEKSWKESQKPHHREHVTSFVYEHPKLFKMQSVKNNEDLSHFRWTVDEVDDLRFVREIYQMMLKRGQEQFFLNDIVALLKDNPDLIKINEAVRQKAI